MFLISISSNNLQSIYLQTMILWPLDWGRRRLTVQLPDSMIMLFCVRWVINKLGSFKYPGRYGIFLICLQAKPKSFYVIMEHFRVKLAEWYILHAWWFSRITFVSKKGRIYLTNTKWFRLFIIFSFPPKTFEILLEWYVKWWVLSETPLNRNKCAYRQVWRQSGY